MSVVLVAVVGVPLVAAIVLGLGRCRRAVASNVAVAVSVAAVIAAIAVLIGTAADGRVDAVLASDDGSAIVGLTADRVGAVLVVLTTLVGLIVQSFASRSLCGDPRAARFHVLGLGLAAATTAVATAATGSLFVVAWIATSIVLFALLGHRAPWPPALAARRRAGWSFAVGDAVLVAAVVATLITVGDIDLSAVGAAASDLEGDSIGPWSALSVVAVLLVLAGVARSALVPIHRWLPATLAAPTPVSALLHAGVVNGAGVLLLRFSPIFGSSATAMGLAFALGLVTAFFATAVMLVRTDVKGGLVWSTAGQMGFMVLQLGVGAFAAALFHIVGHALYKAALFLGAGGAITSHAHQHDRPHLGAASSGTLTSPVVRIALGLVVPLAAFASALAVIDPHLTPGAVILLVTFGTLSTGRAANGWARSAPLAPGSTIVVAVGMAVLSVWAYVGGIALFELFVVDDVPYDVPAAVGPVWVAGSLVAAGLVAAAVAWTPGRSGDIVRRRVYTALQSSGSPAVRLDRPGPQTRGGSTPEPESTPSEPAVAVASTVGGTGS